MAIDVYGKSGCQLCDAAKEKLRLMELDFEFHNIEPILAYHEGWRTDGSAGVLAAYHALDGRLPVIFVDGIAYSYSAAMRKLKARQRAAEKPAEAVRRVEDLPDHRGFKH